MKENLWVDALEACRMLLRFQRHTRRGRQPFLCACVRCPIFWDSVKARRSEDERKAQKEEEKRVKKELKEKKTKQEKTEKKEREKEAKK
ncbi:unnamed protein product [Pleuronectes platessa]|uniref:Uncharacterized protein n=1 Tax=Pleuronectes platessa TaxID=8262 RepID=A0A9N7Z988_PLEPL|nr:unnamed protein product [Pleuronectes platessa]